MNEFFLNSYPHLSKLNLGIKRMNPGEHRNMYFHFHKFSEIVIVLASDKDTRHWAEGQSSLIERGDILLLHPGQVHAYENTSQLSLINLLYYADQLPIPVLDATELKLFRHFTAPAFHSHSPELPVCRLSEQELDNIKKLVDELETELTSGKPGCHLCAFGLFVAVLVYLFRPGGIRDTNQTNEYTATAALNYLNSNFMADITVNELAQMCSLSPRTFYRKFRELTGHTPSEYQLMKKLELAERMLRTTNLPLKQIAHGCGFCDSNYMTKIFSRHYGSPPGAFRKQHCQQLNGKQSL